MTALAAAPAPTAPVPKVLRMSPTALSQWGTCPRSWWYAYVLGHRAPQTAAMALGTQLHAEVERYLGGVPWGSAGSMILDARYRDLVAMARAGEQYLRPLVERVAAGHARVEVKAECPPGVVGPLAFSGRIDLVDDVFRLVVDHKTTSDLRAPWHPDAAALAHDPQMLLYASAVLPPGPPVHVAHIRYRTRGDPLAQMVISPDVPWANVEAAREHAAGVSHAMAALASHPADRAAEVEWSPAGCRKFGGCPHAARCPDSPVNRAFRATTAAYAAPPQESHTMSSATAPSNGAAAFNPMSLFGVAPKPTPEVAAVAARAAMPSAVASLLAPSALAVAAVVPPDARPDDVPAIVRAVAAVRALGGWPGARAAASLAAQNGVSPEALTHAATEAGIGPATETPS